MISQLKRRARALKADTLALYFAYRDPRTPFLAKAVAALTVAYAFSPIDLIPDFIPVLGYLDDLVLVPTGIALALRLIPEEVMRDCRERAKQDIQKPVNWWAAAVVVALWLGALALVFLWLSHR